MGVWCPPCGSESKVGAAGVGRLEAESGSDFRGGAPGRASQSGIGARVAVLSQGPGWGLGLRVGDRSWRLEVRAGDQRQELEVEVSSLGGGSESKVGLPLGVGITGPGGGWEDGLEIVVTAGAGS